MATTGKGFVDRWMFTGYSRRPDTNGPMDFVHLSHVPAPPLFPGGLKYIGCSHSVWAALVPNEAHWVVKIPGFVRLRSGKPFFYFIKLSDRVLVLYFSFFKTTNPFVKNMTAFQTLPPTSRVWVYQSNRPFQVGDVPQLKEYVARFAQNWVSHNHQLRAHGDVLHDQFIVLMVDEGQAGASGCSIDKSVHFLKQIESTYGVDLFDRMTFAWMDGDTVRSADSSEFSRLYQEGLINGQTLVFDNLVKTKGELEEKWLKPLNESWHRRFV